MTDELKPGQKYPTPTKGFGDRVFYETLLRQKTDSEMAQDWCLAYGILSFKEAEKLYKKVLKRKTVKSAPASSSKSKVKSTKKRKIVKEEADDVGMDVGGSEVIGGVTL